MKSALHKPEIPLSRLFVASRLEEKHFDPVWHAHSEYQLFVVLEGSGTRFVGDSIKSFKPGELVLTGPHVPHVWRNDEMYFDKSSSVKTAGIVIYLNENFLGDQFLEKEEMMALKRLFVKSLRGVEFFGSRKLEVVELMKELTQLHGMASVIHLLRILEVLASIKEYEFISSKPYDDPFEQHETDRFNKVYEYTFKNFRKKISLDEVAEVLHMTPTSFSRYFRTKYNKTFSRFISEIRIKHACEMLTETEESVSEICYACGFNTLSNFNKQFKDITSKKPVQYRNEFMTI